MKLVFATNNKNKIHEISSLIGTKLELLSLQEIGCNEELPETQATIEDNASQKAQYVYDKYNVSCFADDTGLEIEALDGRPGVYSARYAGEGKNANDNMDKILAEMEGVENRRACFKTVVSLFLDGKEYSFSGIVIGNILEEKRGTQGFGYDPIFVPDDYRSSFAEMSLEEKNKISHRSIAVKNLVDFLQKI